MAYTARVRLPGSLGQLLRPEMEKAISEANLGNSDSLIAKRYFPRGGNIYSRAYALFFIVLYELTVQG